MRATFLCMLLLLLATCCSLNIKAAHAQQQMKSNTSLNDQIKSNVSINDQRPIKDNKSIIGQNTNRQRPSTISTFGNTFMKMMPGLFNVPIGYEMKSYKKRSSQSSNLEIQPRRAKFYDQTSQENKTMLSEVVDINSRFLKRGGRMRIGGKNVKGTSNGTTMTLSIKLPAGFRPAPAPPHPMLYPFVEERMPLQRQQPGFDLVTENVNTDDWRPIVFKHIPTTGMEKPKPATKTTAQVRRIFESAEEQDEPEQPAQSESYLTDLIDPVILEAMREKVIYGAPKSNEEAAVDLMQQDAVVHDVDYYQAVAKNAPVVIPQAEAEIYNKSIQLMGEYYKIEERTTQQKTTINSKITENEYKKNNSTPSTEEKISFIIEKIKNAVRHKDTTDVNIINKPQTENPINETKITIETPTKLEDLNTNTDNNSENNHMKEQVTIVKNDESTLPPAQNSTTTLPKSSSPLLLTTTTSSLTTSSASLSSSSTSAAAVETVVDAVVEIDTTPIPNTTIKALDAAQQHSNDHADPYSSTTEPSICVPMLVRESSSINPNELVDIERIVCFPLPPDMDFNLTGALKDDDEDQMNQQGEEDAGGDKELVATVQIVTRHFENEFKKSKSCRLGRNLNIYILCWLILKSNRVLLV